MPALLRSIHLPMNSGINPPTNNASKVERPQQFFGEMRVDVDQIEPIL